MKNKVLKSYFLLKILSDSSWYIIEFKVESDSVKRYEWDCFSPSKKQVFVYKNTHNARLDWKGLINRKFVHVTKSQILDYGLHLGKFK